MPSFVTPLPGDGAVAESVAQITEDFQGLRNIPLSLTGINDAASYALTLKNAGTGAKGLIIYAADGTTPLLQVDANGTKVSADGTTPASTVATANSVAAAIAAATPANGSITAAMLASAVGNFGAWTAFTPVLRQNAGVAVTVNNARYALFGKLAVVNLAVTATAAGLSGNTIYLDLPARR